MLAVDRSTGLPYVVYGGNYGVGIIAEKFEGSSWQAVGSAFGERPRGLIFSGNNVPYVCWLGINTTGMASKYNGAGASWESVGAGATTVGVMSMSLAVHSSGETDTPYIAFAYTNPSVPSQQILKVNKLDSTNWIGVGGVAGQLDTLLPNISVDLKVDSEGVPYIKYTDPQNGSRVYIKKYISSMDAWVQLGDLSTGDTGGSVMQLSNGVPYLAYTGISVSGVGTIEVKKYEGGVWNSLGSPGNSNQGVKLFVNGSTPYIFFSDSDQEDKPFLKKHNGASWVGVGDRISDYSSIPYSLEIFAGVPYLTFVYATYPSYYENTVAVKYVGP